MWNKKVFALVLSALVLSVGAAWADDEDRIVSEAEYGYRGGVNYTGGVLPVRDVSEVKDGYPISLRGTLYSESFEDRRFRLEDSTGSIVVFIPEDRWPGYSPGTTVDLFGTVERDASDGSSVIVARHVNLADDN